MNNKKTYKTGPFQDVPWTPFAGIAAAAALPMVSILCNLFIRGDGSTGLALQIFLSDGLVLLGIFGFLLLRVRRGETLSAVWLSIPSPALTARRAIKPFLVVVLATASSLWLQAQMSRGLDLEMPAQPIVDWLNRQQATGHYLNFFLLSVLAITLVPLTEEVIFRGMLYLPLRARFGRTTGALTSSLLFAVMHTYPAGSGTTFIATTAMVWTHLFVLGLLFCLMMEKTMTLWAAILTHGLYNAAMLSIILIAPKFV